MVVAQAWQSSSSLLGGTAPPAAGSAEASAPPARRVLRGAKAKAQTEVVDRPASVVTAAVRPKPAKKKAEAKAPAKPVESSQPAGKKPRKASAKKPTGDPQARKAKTVSAAQAIPEASPVFHGASPLASPIAESLGAEPVEPAESSIEEEALQESDSSVEIETHLDAQAVEKEYYEVEAQIHEYLSGVPRKHHSPPRLHSRQAIPRTRERVQQSPRSMSNSAVSLLSSDPSVCLILPPKVIEAAVEEATQEIQAGLRLTRWEPPQPSAQAVAERVRQWAFSSRASTEEEAITRAALAVHRRYLCEVRQAYENERESIVCSVRDALMDQMLAELAQSLMSSR
eukprot:m51a1_g12090 hypothetical protein (341) ;mRNA; f:642-4010